MELLFYLELSAPEKDCSFVNIPDRSLSDIARLLQMIKYKLYFRQSATQKKTLVPTFQKSSPFQSVDGTGSLRPDYLFATVRFATGRFAPESELIRPT